ncbi:MULTISPECIES: hypothetical protein [unclassified Frondihabitans]|uniref:hypothetical protein n=1 Tax=unclassified Frondihabitans TaxID=2626248 RepID=UPI000F50910C|nr:MULTISPECIES: hypothetical protein [unclassified Frondihabitans]RPE76472.1 hypothetical protein EDF37_2297 [Frondihabitans sp. PhB153]RPF05252.1 hypothetical protein EDF39_1951 [Frondihabitans sp. PhB161]
MTTTTTGNPLARPGASVHFLGTVSLARSLALGSVGILVNRGDVAVLTEELLRANQDRNGASVFDLIDDPDAQIEKYGQVLVAPGPWPEDQPTWVYGTPEWAAAREEARRRAWLVDTAEARSAALAAVERDFGPAAPTSKTLNARGAR